MFLRYAILVLIAMFLFPACLMAASLDRIVFKMRAGTTVTFVHGQHLSKKDKNCKTCHAAIFDLSKRNRFTMAEMERGKSCGSCHNGTKAFSVASDRYCTNCHTSFPGAIYYKIKGADAFFSHDSHVARNSGECKNCHNGRVISGKRGITMHQMEKGVSCGACHNGDKAFIVSANCGSCHKGLVAREITFKMKPGITDANFSHDKHTAVYHCHDCHTKLFPYTKAGAVRYSMAEMEKGKSCGSCHDGKVAFASSGDCAKCHKGFKTAPITFKVKLGAKDGYFSHEFHLGMYKCQDCHTKIFPFGRGKTTTMADMQKNASCGACHNGKDAFNVTGDCDKCHRNQ